MIIILEDHAKSVVHISEQIPKDRQPIPPHPNHKLAHLIAEADRAEAPSVYHVAHRNLPERPAAVESERAD